MARVVKFSNELRDSIEEALDKGDYTGKIRPYYYGIRYNEKIILIPLRTDCPRKFSLFIRNIHTNFKYIHIALIGF